MTEKKKKGGGKVVSLKKEKKKTETAARELARLAQNVDNLDGLKSHRRADGLLVAHLPLVVTKQIELNDALDVLVRALGFENYIAETAAAKRKKKTPRAFSEQTGKNAIISCSHNNDGSKRLILRVVAHDLDELATVSCALSTHINRRLFLNHRGRVVKNAQELADIERLKAEAKEKTSKAKTLGIKNENSVGL